MILQCYEYSLLSLLLLLLLLVVVVIGITVYHSQIYDFIQAQGAEAFADISNQLRGLGECGHWSPGRAKDN